MRYSRDDGALVIVDMERDGWVFFRSWRAGQENAAWVKMPRQTFDEAIAKEGMRRGEVCALLTNLGQEAIYLCHGDRVCQAVLAPVVRVDELSQTERGAAGFGSTGLR